MDYKQLIREEVPEAQRPTGPILYKDGKVLGQHKGLPFYTIGQREGLGISVGRPLYVMKLDVPSNTLVVGEKEDVFSEAMLVREVTWVNGQAPAFPAKADVKIRYKHKEDSAHLEADASGRIRVRFDEAQSAITPGQAAVFYQDDRVLGGGVIHQAVARV